MGGERRPGDATHHNDGEGADPLYAWLKRETPGSDGRDIEWNFAKFLIGRDGKPVRRYGDKFDPGDMAPDIEDLLER